jgi:hypothetical protein
MMVYSVAPASCAVESHLDVLLHVFRSDVSLQLAQLTRASNHVGGGPSHTQRNWKLELSSGESTLYQTAASAHTLATFRFRNHRPKYFGKQQGGKQELLCALRVTVAH